jgi:hypothetical protein
LPPRAGFGSGLLFRFFFLPHLKLLFFKLSFGFCVGSRIYKNLEITFYNEAFIDVVIECILCRSLLRVYSFASQTLLMPRAGFGSGLF